MTEKCVEFPKVAFLLNHAYITSCKNMAKQTIKHLPFFKTTYPNVEKVDREDIKSNGLISSMKTVKFKTDYPTFDYL